MTYFLFYLLLLFLPIQLARHFFFDFTQISGIRSDYLAPTIYFTDIIILFIIGLDFVGYKHYVIPNRQLAERNLSRMRGDNSNKLRDPSINLGMTIGAIVILYLLFNSFFIAVNHWAAFYKLVKITEFILLFFAIIKLKPKTITIASVLSISVLYSSVLAFWQFAIQKSIGGIFWFLGERTFYADTPGIAATSINGNLLLRPYATFPHPNVLGGFLAIALPYILYVSKTGWQKIGKIQKTLITTGFIFGIAALILTFSRAAWLVSLFGFAAVYSETKFSVIKKISKARNISVTLIYIFIVLSVVIFLPKLNFSFAKNQYWRERADLVKTTIAIIADKPFFGVGLNNSIIQAQNYVKNFPGLYITQPVHNIFLLSFAETGITGFSFLVILLLLIFQKAANNKTIYLCVLLQLFLLGLFDHYLFTLQQGELLLIIFTALSFSQKVAS